MSVISPLIKTFNKSQKGSIRWFPSLLSIPITGCTFLILLIPIVLY